MGISSASVLMLYLLI